MKKKNEAVKKIVEAWRIIVTTVNDITPEDLEALDESDIKEVIEGMMNILTNDNELIQKILQNLYVDLG